jgi:hypothetical protein
VVRDGHGDLKLTEVKDAQAAHQFVEAFNALIAVGGAPDLTAADQLGADLDAQAVTTDRATFREVLRGLPAGADPDDMFDALRNAAA